MSGELTLLKGVDLDTINKTIGIKLKLTKTQKEELSNLSSAFKIGINFSLQEIEKRYQNFLKTYTIVKKDKQVKDICEGCKSEKVISYINNTNSKKYCSTCATVSYSEYTVRKEIYGTADRTIENDIKNIVDIPNKTHYSMLFSQAYATWKSYNAWRTKRIRECELLENTIAKMDSRYVSAAMLIEQKAADMKRYDTKLMWKHAKALASKEIYRDFSDEQVKEIVSAHDKIMDLRKLKRPIHFPHFEECRTMMMSANFVTWENEVLYLVLWNKGRQKVDFWGKEYLKNRIAKMEADNNVYCNITKKVDDYYLMYPLEIKVRQPPALNECDAFVVVSSPTKIGVFGYDSDGVINTFKWFSTGKLVFAKRNFKDKRAEITSRKHPNEKMRRIRRRRKKVKNRGHMEQRFVSTFNHQITRKIIDHIMEQSENPKIIIWDIGNGITQNFGKQLNYLKNLWPVVQQQDYLIHKAMQVSIPVVETQYTKCNELVCSSCGAKQKNGKKTAKVITQLIKNIKNFKCEKCGYEVNMLMNQANIIANVQ